MRMVIYFDGRCRVAERHDKDLSYLVHSAKRKEIVSANTINPNIVADPRLMRMNECGVFVISANIGGRTKLKKVWMYIRMDRD